MADEPTQNSTPAAPIPRVLLIVDDESLARFGPVCKHIVVGLADALPRLVTLAITQRPPGALELGPCEIIHTAPRHWPMTTRPSKDVITLAAERKVNAILCLSADLLQWVLHQPELSRLPAATFITDRSDLDRWIKIQSARPQLYGLPATPSLFQAALSYKRVPLHYLKLVSLGIISQNCRPVLAVDEQHIMSAVLITPLTSDCGLATVLRAMNRIPSAAGQDLALFVLGKGSAERQFRLLAEELKLSNAVTFVGEVSQWEEALQGSDTLVVSRTPPRWTSHILQAMAYGRTVLAPDDSDEDYMVHEQTALLYKTGSVDDLAAKWGTIVNNKEHAQSLGDAARMVVKNHHGISRMADAIVSVFTEMITPAPQSG